MKDLSKPDDTGKKRREFRYTKVGSVIASFDFYLGVPLGAVAAVFMMLSDEALKELPSVLLGVAGIGAALVTLVLTAMAVLIATISTEYAVLLRKVPGGMSGTAKPYLFVAKTAALATVTALIGVGMSASVDGNYFLLYLSAAAPFSLLVWSVLGCVQVASGLVYHWEKNMEAIKIVPLLQEKGKL